MIACFRVIALLPTEVPIAFATSLAPIPYAIKNPTIDAIITIARGLKNRVSILFLRKNFTLKCYHLC